jgi:hypothetical protein
MYSGRKKIVGSNPASKLLFKICVDKTQVQNYPNIFRYRTQEEDKMA